MNNLIEVTNEEVIIGDEELTTDAHDVKIGTNNLIKIAKSAKIPMFISYYLPDKGYVYDGVLPEELYNDNISAKDIEKQSEMEKAYEEKIKKQYGKFLAFLKCCLDFNKEDYKPIIKTNDEEEE